MVHVIFLDIDGVICCNMTGRLEDNKLDELKRIVSATSAKVVLSTDWRRQAQLKRQVIMTLKKRDIEVIGATPCRAMYSPIRPQEITEWMTKNAADVGVEGWVAIDDRDLVNEHGGPALQGHFVRTHPNTGLTNRLAEVCIKILTGTGDSSSATGSSTPLGEAPMVPPATAHAAAGTTSNPARAGAVGRSASPHSSPHRRPLTTAGGAASAPSSLQAVKAVQAGSGFGAATTPHATGGRRSPPPTPGTRTSAGHAVTPTAKQRAGAAGTSPSKRWQAQPFVLPSD